jgi:hypothetical protein
VDLTREIIYRSFVLNDEDIADSTTGGGGAGTGIIGCVVDSADFSDVDVVQFLEKRSQRDGMDAGDVFLGTRRLRMAGTLYNVTRAALYDSLADLRAALSPVLAQREEPLDRGYRPLYFSVPTNRLDDFPGGIIEMRLLALPRAFQALFDRDQLGGEDEDSLAIPWQATFVMRDPTLQGLDPQDYEPTTQTEVTSATATASTDLIGKTSHGLVAGDRVRITTLGTGGAGLNTTTNYYVLASGLTSSAFKVSLTSGGSAINITSDSTGLKYVKSVTTSGNLTNRGTYLAPVNMLFVVGRASGSIAVTMGDSIFTITVPASTGERIIRVRDDGVITFEEDDVEVPSMSAIAFSGDTTWPLIDPDTSAYSITVHGCILAEGSHFWFYERYA